MISLARTGRFVNFLPCCNGLQRGFCASVLAIKNKERISYDDWIRSRQTEAERSVVIQVNSEKSFPELYNYCSKFGNIINALHYSVRSDDDVHYILLEFSEPKEAATALSSSEHNDDISGVPVRSPFLWFKAVTGHKMKAIKKQTPPSNLLQVIEGTYKIKSGDLNYLMRSAENMEDQIKILHNALRLNDLGVRLRFIAALQVQSALSGLFPNATAKPFGSSVNGFGKMGCDLDLILNFDNKAEETSEDEEESRLIFHTKENLANERSQTQRQMESIGDMMQLFLPGVVNVRRILQARVPILKYHHEHLDLDVDLTINNMSGSHMSELLYLFGELDDRVRPLTFSIRNWAHESGLTNSSPGRWITNFSLTCLVMFFLQQLNKPVLPPISDLVKCATQKDVRTTEDGVDCTFARDLDQINFHSENNSQMKDLLQQFFEFYSNFDFYNRAISLNDGHYTTKPDHSALYIVNPFEQILNISKNISFEECEHFRMEARNAAWNMESELTNSFLTTERKLKENWGLLKILQPSRLNAANAIAGSFLKPRLVDVSDLFEKTEHKGSISRGFHTRSVFFPIPAIPKKPRNTVDLRPVINKETMMHCCNCKGSDGNPVLRRTQMQIMRAEARLQVHNMRFEANNGILGKLRRLHLMQDK